MNLDLIIKGFTSFSPEIVKSLYSQGGCFFFAKFLKDLVPDLLIYEVINDPLFLNEKQYAHFVVSLGDGKFYDINGLFGYGEFLVINGLCTETLNELKKNSKNFKNLIYVRLLEGSEIELINRNINSYRWNYPSWEHFKKSFEKDKR